MSTEYPDDGGLFERAAKAGDEIATAYEACDYREATRLIMLRADAANEYVEQQAPWALRKDVSRARELQDVCTVVLNLFRQIAIYLQPVLPTLASKTAELLGCEVESWDNTKTPQSGSAVAKFRHMMKRLEADKLTAMFAAARMQADTGARG